MSEKENIPEFMRQQMNLIEDDAVDKIVMRFDRLRLYTREEITALEKLKTGKPMVVTSDEKGPWVIDWATAWSLKNKGLVKLDQRLFHLFAWGV
jgi:hypothetical protein